MKTCIDDMNTPLPGCILNTWLHIKGLLISRWSWSHVGSGGSVWSNESHLNRWAEECCCSSLCLPAQVSLINPTGLRWPVSKAAAGETGETGVLHPHMKHWSAADLLIIDWSDVSWTLKMILRVEVDRFSDLNRKPQPEVLLWRDIDYWSGVCLKHGIISPLNSVLFVHL